MCSVRCTEHTDKGIHLCAQYSVLSTQMNTFISEYSAKFYTQVLDVDTEWDNYIKQLNDMGMNDMIGIYQSALDRYNER